MNAASLLKTAQKFFGCYSRPLSSPSSPLRISLQCPMSIRVELLFEPPTGRSVAVDVFGGLSFAQSLRLFIVAFPV